MRNARFEVADVEASAFDEHFDLAFSRMGTMFFANPVAALRNVRKALVPGGRLAMVVWRSKVENDCFYRGQLITERFVTKPEEYDEPTCGPGPFSMANADTTSGILLSAGFENIALQRCDQPIAIGVDLDEAVEFVMSIGPAGEILRLAGEQGRAPARAGRRGAARGHGRVGHARRKVLAPGVDLDRHRARAGLATAALADVAPTAPRWQPVVRCADAMGAQLGGRRAAGGSAGCGGGVGRRVGGDRRTGERVARGRLPHGRAADHPRRISRAAGALQPQRRARHDAARLARQGADRRPSRDRAELRRQLPRPDARDLRRRHAARAPAERHDRTDEPAHARLPRLAGSQPRQRLRADRPGPGVRLRIQHPARHAGGLLLVPPAPAHVRRAADLRRPGRGDRAGGRARHAAGAAPRPQRWIVIQNTEIKRDRIVPVGRIQRSGREAVRQRHDRPDGEDPPRTAAALAHLQRRRRPLRRAAPAARPALPAARRGRPHARASRSASARC